LTDFEKKQQHHVFVSAGRKAYRMDVPLSSNPYMQKPWRDLWEKGWRYARVEEMAKEHGVPPPRFFEQKQQYRPKPVAAPVQAKPQPKPQESVSTDRLVNKFNRRYRTAV
jgi:hypothetical protein